MIGWVCGGSPRRARRTAECPGCLIVGEHSEAVESSPYYAPIKICTNCGEVWSDVIHERPFARGWRQRNIIQAIKHWEAACGCPQERDYDGYLISCPHERQRGCIPITTHTTREDTTNN